MLTPEQIERRRNGLGGSDAAAAVGLSRYKTPLQLYLEKTSTGTIPPQTFTEHLHFGSMLEDLIAREYARRTNTKVQRSKTTHKHKIYPWMIAHVDRIVVGEQKILECKNVSEYAHRKSWGEEGSDEIPPEVYCQVTHYMCVLDMRSADVAAIVGGNRLKIYHVEYDPKIADALIDGEHVFWKHVVDLTPPAPMTLEDIDELYGQDDKADLYTHPDKPVRIMVERYAQARRQLLAAKEQLEQCEQEIKLDMAGYARLVDSTTQQVLVTWKQSKDGKVFDLEKFRREFPQLASMYEKTRPGARRFIVCHDQPKRDDTHLRNAIEDYFGEA